MAAMQPQRLTVQQIPGERLCILGSIGRGGFGEVYLANDLDRHEKCAIKCLIGTSDWIHEVDHKNLIKEAEKMLHARDEYVLNIYGVCTIPVSGVCGLVLPYMPQGSLDRLLQNDDVEIPWALRVRILHQVARGMNALHLLSPIILHRDLKPGNILLTDNFSARVSDFGLSQIKELSTLSRPSIRSRNLVGTLTHIAPEYLQNVHQSPSTKFDVYSFGIMVWEMLTRQTPYRYAANTEVMRHAVISGQRPDESQISSNNSLHHGLEPVIVPLMKRCWAQKPTERPEFKEIVGEMKDLVEQFAKDAEDAVRWIKQKMGNPIIPEPKAGRSKPLETWVGESRCKLLREIQDDEVSISGYSEEDWDRRGLLPKCSKDADYYVTSTNISKSELIHPVSNSHGQTIPKTLSKGAPEPSLSSMDVQEDAETLAPRQNTGSPIGAPVNTSSASAGTHSGASAGTPAGASTRTHAGAPVAYRSPSAGAGAGTGSDSDDQEPEEINASESRRGKLNHGPRYQWNTIVNNNFGNPFRDGSCRAKPPYGNFTQFNIQHVEHLHLGGTHHYYSEPSPQYGGYSSYSPTPPDIQIPNPNGPVTAELKDKLISKIHQKSGDGQNFFSGLGLSKYEMKEIYNSNRNLSLAQLLQRMFDKWEEKKGRGNATRDCLKKACLRMGRMDLIVEISMCP